MKKFAKILYDVFLNKNQTLYVGGISIMSCIATNSPSGKLAKISLSGIL
jgi:hypothetical protein